VRRRAFCGPDDLYRLQEFTSQCIRHHGRVGLLHPGDVAHHVYNGLRHDDPANLVYIWEDEDEAIRAWTLLDPRNAGHDPQVDPDARRSHPGLERDVNVWSEQALLRLLAERSSDAHVIETDASEGDTERRELLVALGWEETDEEILWVTRRELGNVAEPVIPPGYRIRTVSGLDEAGGVGELHGACFGSAWTAELYARVMTSPGYSSEREFLVEAPDGELAAFCVTWPDPGNGVGLFEPVAVHPKHRRLGLARAVMRAGMAAMQSWGMTHAEVLYADDNPASGPLYRSEGFTPVGRILLFKKNVGAA